MTEGSVHYVKLKDDSSSIMIATVEKSFNRGPRGRLVITPNESPSQNKEFTYLLTNLLTASAGSYRKRNTLQGHANYKRIK